MSRDFAAAGSLTTGANTAQVTTTPLTLACWFQTDTLTADQCLVGVQLNSGGGNNNRFALFALGATGLGDRIGALARTTTTAQAETTTSFSTGTWHHACAVFTSDTDRAAYIDGGSKGTNATSRAPTPQRYVHATSNDGTSILDGRIAEIAIWNAALTDEEVASLARGVSPLEVRPESLLEYWPIIGRTSPEINLADGPQLTVTSGTVAVHPRVYYPKRRLFPSRPAFVAPTGDTILRDIAHTPSHQIQMAS